MVLRLSTSPGNSEKAGLPRFQHGATGLGRVTMKMISPYVIASIPFVLGLCIGFGGCNRKSSTAQDGEPGEAVTALFEAARSGDASSIARCYTPQAAQASSLFLVILSDPQAKERFLVAMQQLQQVEIISEQVSDNRAVAKAALIRGGHRDVEEFELRRINGVWYVD